MTAHTHPVVRAYLGRVRTALSDLPTSEIEEIVEDVRPQLTEIVQRLGDGASLEAVVAEIGAPESYAAEVRATGEYPPAPHETVATEKPRTMIARVALAGLLAATICAAAAGMTVAVNLDDNGALPLLLLTVVLMAGAAGYLVVRGADDLSTLPEVRRLLELRAGREAVSRGGSLLRALNPVWWVMSAALLGLLAVATAVGPGRGILSLAILLVLAGIAMWAGPKSARDSRWAAVAIPLSALVLGAGVGAAGFVLRTLGEDPPPYEALYTDEQRNLDMNGDPLLYYGPRPLHNLYVFDSDGNALTDVYLYDEDGTPVLVPRYACDPYLGEEIQVGTDNRFPRPHIELGGFDERGVVNGYEISQPFCEEVDDVPFTVAVPGGK